LRQDRLIKMGQRGFPIYGENFHPGFDVLPSQVLSDSDPADEYPVLYDLDLDGGILKKSQ